MSSQNRYRNGTIQEATRRKKKGLMMLKKTLLVFGINPAQITEIDKVTAVPLSRLSLRASGLCEKNC